ncbi:MAG TPA: site-2 protease family protein [Gaiellaceae bacterium]|nr:site-2 protease family protein [Gaiellaceae bacterium]
MDRPGQLARPRRGALLRLAAPLLLVGGLALKLGGSLKFLAVFASLGGYALIWGWQFALGFVALILVHELGHYLEARRQGLDPSLPVFIPFLGAYVAIRNAPFDPWRNAKVTLAGPLLGGAVAALLLAAGAALDSRLLLALAYAGFFLNLLNLVPVGFLDGGRLLESWRVLRHGAGAPTPPQARALAARLAVLSLATAAGLAVGMAGAHVPQDRL